MPEEPYSDFTIEDVSSIVRMEKGSGQLSVVRKDLYPAMIALQEREARNCEKKSVDSLDYDLAVDRRRKLVSNVKLVVEYRMNKVAAMAIRGAMGTQNVVEQLPPEEKQYYEEVFEAAKKLWNAPYKKKKTVYTPEIVPSEVPATPDVPEIPAEELMPPEPEPPIEILDDMADIMYPDEQPAEVPAEPAPVAEGEVQVEPQEEENPYADCFDLVTVRIIDTVEPFAGTERSYSLKKEDVVRLPKSLATILVSRKLAVILST